MYYAYSLLINIFYSFYNWDSHIAVWKSTPNYQVIADNPEGLLFKYKRDRKILRVDPKVNLLLHLYIFPNFIVFLSLFYYLLNIWHVSIFKSRNETLCWNIEHVLLLKEKLQNLINNHKSIRKSFGRI